MCQGSTNCGHVRGRSWSPWRRAIRGIDDFAVRGKGVKDRLLILTHEAAIAIDVGAQDGCKRTLEYSPLEEGVPKNEAAGCEPVPAWREFYCLRLSGRASGQSASGRCDAGCLIEAAPLAARSRGIHQGIQSELGHALSGRSIFLLPEYRMSYRSKRGLACLGTKFWWPARPAWLVLPR